MSEHQEKLWTKEFIIITICNFLLFFNLQMTLPSFPVYVKGEFHASSFIISLVTSVFALSAICTRFLISGPLEKGRAKQILYLGIGMGGLATAGYYFSLNIPVLLCIRILFGIGFGMASASLPTIVSNVIPQKRMGEGIGYFGLSTSLAMSIGPMIGLMLLGNYGFGTLVSFSTIIVLAIFPLIFTNRTKLAAAPTPAKSALHSGKNGQSVKKLLLPAFLNFMLSITYGGLLSFLALYGKEVHLAHVGLFFLFNALAIFIIRPFSGKIFDSKGHFGIMTLGGILVFSGLFTLSLASSMVLLILSSVLYGLGYGMIQPSIQAWMIKEVSPEQRGIANVFFFNTLDLGVAVGSMLLGVIAMDSNYSVMYRSSALCMALFLVVYLSTHLLNRQRQFAA